MCTSSGPGSAALASSWQAQHGLQDVLVWGDTTDYMYQNFSTQLGGSYPFTMVVKLDTMELTYMSLGDVHSATSAIDAILADVDECAE